MLGLESSARILLVPVSLKERVAALLIASPQQSDDLAGVELLVQVAELTLDLQSLPQGRSGCPRRAAAAASRQSPKQRRRLFMPRAAAGHELPRPPAASLPAMSSAPPAIQPVLDEAHEKARRFAKLLVEEIKLYNQTKLAEGRARGDIYSRLREDIEKSRGAYQKRYGESVKDADYFTQELMRILADNNRAVMGPGFPG